MITLIICLVLGLIVGIFMQFDEGEGLFAGIVLGFLLGLGIGFCIKVETTDVKKVAYLETINDNNVINGSFFLGSGNINGVWKYTYYYKDGDAFYLKQINAIGTPIKYTNTKPRIEWIETIVVESKRNKWSLRTGRYPEISKITIFIPEGSILQNYNLDAK